MAAPDCAPADFPLAWLDDLMFSGGALRACSAFLLHWSGGPVVHNVTLFCSLYQVDGSIVEDIEYGTRANTGLLEITLPCQATAVQEISFKIVSDQYNDNVAVSRRMPLLADGSIQLVRVVGLGRTYQSLTLYQQGIGTKVNSGISGDMADGTFKLHLDGEFGKFVTIEQNLFSILTPGPTASDGIQFFSTTITYVSSVVYRSFMLVSFNLILLCMQAKSFHWPHTGYHSGCSGGSAPVALAVCHSHT